MHFREEEVFLSSLISTLYRNSDVWIGMKFNMTSISIYEQYRWLDGSKVVYSNWYNKEPDPRHGDYVKLTVRNGPTNFLYWLAAVANESLPYFCKQNPGMFSCSTLSLFKIKDM